VKVERRKEGTQIETGVGTEEAEKRREAGCAACAWPFFPPGTYVIPISIHSADDDHNTVTCTMTCGILGCLSGLYAYAINVGVPVSK
jgi:hypothetical protein